ncbi:MAG: hypothetical protein IT350_17560 [Deltaproteobacteria bacterium]|nr:hypothetical protein [Deltaproteobacteria bacterium]
MKTLRLLFVAVVLVAVLGACQKPVDDGSLPTEQAKGPIDTVQNWTVGDGLKLSERIAKGLAGMRGKGARVDEKGWRAYPGPSDCAGCTLVHYVVAINGESEKYEFLVKDGGKAVEGVNEGTKILLAGPAPRAPKAVTSVVPAGASPEGAASVAPPVPVAPAAPGSPPVPSSPPAPSAAAPAPSASPSGPAPTETK